MAHVVKIDSLKRYPKKYVSKLSLKYIKKDGLITPICVYRNGEVHDFDIERYEAFCRLAVVDDIIVYYYDELSYEEKLDI